MPIYQTQTVTMQEEIEQQETVERQRSALNGFFQEITTLADNGDLQALYDLGQRLIDMLRNKTWDSSFKTKDPEGLIRHLIRTCREQHQQVRSQVQKERPQHSSGDIPAWMIGRINQGALEVTQLYFGFLHKIQNHDFIDACRLFNNLEDIFEKRRDMDNSVLLACAKRRFSQATWPLTDEQFKVARQVKLGAIDAMKELLESIRPKVVRSKRLYRPIHA